LKFIKKGLAANIGVQPKKSFKSYFRMSYLRVFFWIKHHKWLAKKRYIILSDRVQTDCCPGNALTSMIGRLRSFGMK